MKALSLQTVVYKEDKYFVAQCLDVDVSSFGESEKEALDNLREALELYFEDKSASDIHKVDSAKVVSLELQNA